MRNIEPPLGRGSAVKCFEIFASLGAMASMNALIGACTLSRKRCLFASNHARSLFTFSSRKKTKKSLGKPLNVMRARSRDRGRPARTGYEPPTVAENAGEDARGPR